MSSVRPPLSPSQAQALGVIRGYLLAHGRAPTIREIGTAMGAASPRAPQELVERLIHKGYLERPAPKQARGLRLVEVSR